MNWLSFLIGAVVGWLVEFFLCRQRRMADVALFRTEKKNLQEDLDACKARSAQLDLEVERLGGERLGGERLGAELAARPIPISSEAATDIPVLRAPEVAVDLAAAPSQPVEPDDLTVLEGIGPRIGELLNENGVTSFAQLAAMGVERLRSILDSGGSRFRIADPATWPEQAAFARDGKWDELKAFQNTLKHGRVA